MDSEKLQRIQAQAREIAALLYEETSPEQLPTLEGIETVVRGHILNYVSPEIGVFLSPQAAAKAGGRTRPIKSILGEIAISESQAKSLEVKSRTQLSPYIAKCCLLVSANVSYERSSEDILVPTGMKVS